MYEGMLKLFAFCSLLFSMAHPSKKPIYHDTQKGSISRISHPGDGRVRDILSDN